MQKKKLYVYLAVLMFVFQVLLVTQAHATSNTYYYVFNPVVDENTGLALNYTTVVNVKFPNGTGLADQNFSISAYTPVAKTFTAQPLYFHIYGSPLAIDSAGDRYIYVTPSDNNTVIQPMNITQGAALSYTMQFTDLTHRMTTAPTYIVFQTVLNGSYVTIQKLLVDTSLSISVSAVYKAVYHMVISDGNYNNFAYGSVLFADTNPIGITITTFTFPDTTIIGPKVFQNYAWKTNNSINFLYHNGMNDTSTIFLNIYYLRNGTIVYPLNSLNSTLNDWSIAVAVDAYEDYYVIAISNSTTFGLYTYQTYLYQNNEQVNPFSFNFFSSSDYHTEYIIPLIFILAVAGIFSYVDANIGILAFLILALFFYSIGWIPMDMTGFIVIFVFAVINGLVRGFKK